MIYTSLWGFTMFHHHSSFFIDLLVDFCRFWVTIIFHHVSPSFFIMTNDWLVVSSYPLWKMMEFVSWDDELFPTEWKVIKIMFQSTNQSFFIMKSPLFPDAPWCWYIYLQNWVIFRANVGKYSIYQDASAFGMPSPAWVTWRGGNFSENETRVGFLPWRNGQNRVKP